jgi:Na+/citrate or Na+/malate symporter
MPLPIYYLLFVLYVAGRLNSSWRLSFLLNIVFMLFLGFTLCITVVSKPKY